MRTDYAAAFQRGDTNTPLLAMDWLSGRTADEYCRVGRSGKVSSARYVVNWAVQGSRFADLSQTNLELLIATVNRLPPPPTAAPPPERWIVVQGIRSNQWFKSVYDRGNVPEAVEALYDLTGASLVWFIPRIEGRLIARTKVGGFGAVATEAPVAFSAGPLNPGSTGNQRMQVWNLEAANQEPPLFELFPYQGEDWAASAITPDGSIGAVANSHNLCGIDLKACKLLWRAGPLDQAEHHGKIIVVGNKGRSLFTAGAHNIERWDIKAGQRLAILTTNSTIVQHLSTSYDGSVLLAGCGMFNRFPSEFTVWVTSKDEPAARFAEPDLSGIGISPDGRQIALGKYGQKALEIYDWRTGRRRGLRLRCPYAASSACAFYWSPDGQRLAAHVATFPTSIVVYDTAAWKPLAQWDCGHPGPPLRFYFTKSGMLVRLRGGELHGLDTTGLTAVGD
jgi:hypothetical protein